MKLCGRIVDVGEERDVETSYGTRSLAELSVVRTDDAGGDGADPIRVTLWGKWTQSADHAEPGMDVVVTAAEESEFRGETTYATSKESYVVLEPDFLVDVTDIRSWVQCPRMYYLNKLSGIPLNYPVVKGTIVHEVFGDLLRRGDAYHALLAGVCMQTTDHHAAQQGHPDRIDVLHSRVDI